MPGAQEDVGSVGPSSPPRAQERPTGGAQCRLRAGSMLVRGGSWILTASARSREDPGFRNRRHLRGHAAESGAAHLALGCLGFQVALFWKPEPNIKVPQGHAPSGGAGEGPAASPSAWWPHAVLGLRPHHSGLCLRLPTASPCICVQIPLLHEAMRRCTGPAPAPPPPANPIRRPNS